MLCTLYQAVDHPDVVVVSFDPGKGNVVYQAVDLPDVVNPLPWNIKCVYQAFDLPDVVVVSLDPGTVNTKMLLAGWGECGIPVSEADDTFWLITTQAGLLK